MKSTVKFLTGILMILVFLRCYIYTENPSNTEINPAGYSRTGFVANQYYDSGKLSGTIEDNNLVWIDFLMASAEKITISIRDCKFVESSINILNEYRYDNN